ncbi:MAG TPA: hypothetical protein VMW19_06005 [Myxococcota bacterium]|nr:hypothetical protein [Myxococcota bacterium]
MPIAASICACFAYQADITRLDRSSCVSDQELEQARAAVADTIDRFVGLIAENDLPADAREFTNHQGNHEVVIAAYFSDGRDGNTRVWLYLENQCDFRVTIEEGDPVASRKTEQLESALAETVRAIFPNSLVQIDHTHVPILLGP